ncbi:unnamed protein product [Bursaphelenchus okinawaensis]|uniref:V-type proton ATPase subunit n=1 Tax=Bursaphelenchus okinawaensis TaxID=465554 RepID=A0A811LPQ2_9BILA|nr:unnamed protein product [Bursaphelenchus okinawaensis]CAG9127241.1 unnamed protein product [Bursaphelenchus okinawaensis]
MRYVVIAVNLFWLFVFLVGYSLSKRHGLIRTGLMLTAVCCYTFWLIVFLHQMNPLIGPEIPKKDLWWINERWGAVHTLNKREVPDDCSGTCYKNF